MSEMCDVNDKLGDDMLLYKHNETKMLDWLRVKVLGVASTLAEKRRARQLRQQKTHVDFFVLSGQSAKSMTDATPAEPTGLIHNASHHQQTNYTSMHLWPY